MEPWKEELYHYGIKGMRWRKRNANNVSDSGLSEDAANLKYWDRNRREIASMAARSAYTTRKMMERGVNPGGVRQVAKNLKKVSKHANNSYNTFKDAIDRKYHKKVKNRKTSGLGVRHKGQSYVRRVLS